MPTQLTSDQALDLSDKMLNAAIDLRQYRRENKATLTTEQFAELTTKEAELRLRAQSFAACSISCTVAELDDAITQLTAGINQLKKVSTNLDNVKKILGAATTLVSLGAAVASGNPSGIANALLATATTFRSTSPEEARV